MDIVLYNLGMEKNFLIKAQNQKATKKKLLNLTAVKETKTTLRQKRITLTEVKQLIKQSK